MRRGVIITSTLLMFMLIITPMSISYTNENPNPGHNAEQITIYVNSEQMTLQNAIGNELLIGQPEDNFNIAQDNYYLEHITNEIWVSVNNEEKTLQEAIASSGLCSTSGAVDDYSDNNKDHTAKEILVYIQEQETTLQDAIDNSMFCCKSKEYSACNGNALYWFDSCDNPEEIIQNCPQGCENDACIEETEPEIIYYWESIGGCGLGHGGSMSDARNYICNEEMFELTKTQALPIVMGPGLTEQDQQDTIYGVGGSCSNRIGGPYVRWYQCKKKILT